jgi:hypothetical protein
LKSVRGEVYFLFLNISGPIESVFEIQNGFYWNLASQLHMFFVTIAEYIAEYRTSQGTTRRFANENSLTEFVFEKQMRHRMWSP